MVNDEATRTAVIRSLKAALEKNDVPAVLLADIVEESEYDVFEVDALLEEFRHESNGVVRVGKSGGVTLYWLDEHLAEVLDSDEEGLSNEKLLERL